MDLSERKLKILQAIIADFIKNAEPVGSRTLSKNYALGISPANHQKRDVRSGGDGVSDPSAYFIGKSSFRKGLQIVCQSDDEQARAYHGAEDIHCGTAS